MRLAIRGGYVLDPAGGTDAVRDVFCARGKVVGLGTAAEEFEAEQVVDAQGCLVMPGAVDLAVCLNPMGEQRASVESETRAAVAGGVTTVCSVAETQPIPDSPAAVRLLMEQAQQAGFARLETLGAAMHGLGDTQLASLGALREAGCVGVSNGTRPYANLLVLRRAMEYAASQDLTLFYHPLDHALAGRGCAHEGTFAARLGLPGILPAAETAALAQMTALVQDTGARVHFCRLSCAQAVDMLEIGRQAGLPVTADVAVHQLFLTEEAVEGFEVNALVSPPLRTEQDRQRLREGVRDGVIQAICSDHQPLDPDSKMAPFPEARPGISGIETLLPLTMELVTGDILTRATAVERLTAGPAEILGRNTGTLAVGAPADLCVVRLDDPWTFDVEAMLSAGRNTPFDGWQFHDRVQATVCGGDLVYEREEGA